MKSIITRFPPSPTGYLHVGGARTALFNWLYARRMNGRFVLRIEDTDAARSTDESVQAIFDALNWLGIDWDDGPYYQSRRMDIYREHIRQLLAGGHAYWCTCDADQIEAMRQKARQSGGKPKYDGTCRHRDLPCTPGAVVRFKSPPSGTTILPDVVKGHIVFQNNELDDFIIQRSDGSPTYNLAVVVDDVTMGINTVIRGDDHVNNTPKQILLYKALGADLPTFGHVPMVLGQDRARLSKRHGAMSVTAYRDMGFLPEALLNYLVRLGWSHGDQEFFTIQDMLECFNLENIGRSAGIFDPEKLLALNADHIKAARPADLAKPLMPFLAQSNITVDNGPNLENVIETLQTRCKTLVDMAQDAAFYYASMPIQYDQKAARKFLKTAAEPPLSLLLSKLRDLEAFEQVPLENVFKAVMDETGMKLGKIAQPLRVALTGKTISPGIFEIMIVLGKSRVIERLEQALAHIRDLT